MKRFKAETQGYLGIVWNVVDMKLNIFRRHGITGKGARAEAIKVAQKLNQDKRYSQ